ncbi:MAG: hypothetical protein EAZ76_03310 [Nostocales cyanobacterium]|nr:MAG: hypothetical protein EAZ87_14515 [Nostocales cyanobacterium]TAF19454.1 MAG: hypothetical protein EAZ76_03310 [Nostocales cyanobacterium]
MNIAKLIFVACHVFLASLLFVVNPAQASTKWQVTHYPDQVVTTFVQTTPQFTAPIVNQNHHQINKINHHLGCGCSACVSGGNFAILQGKLPVAGF